MSSIQCRTGVARRGLQVREAADVGGGDRMRAGRPAARRACALRSSPESLRLQERVGARRAAAQVRIGHRRELVARAREQRLDLAAHLLAVLQRAGRLERDRAAVGRCASDLGRARLRTGRCVMRRNARRLVAVRRIVREQMPVLLHRRAAAARRHHDRLDLAALDERPPGVDQRAHVVAALLLVVEVKAQRAAAARARRLDERDARGGRARAPPRR